VRQSEALVAERWAKRGWKVTHRGAPDLLLTKPGEKPKFIEVKTSPGSWHVAKDQAEWLAALRSLGADASVEDTYELTPVVHLSFSEDEYARLKKLAEKEDRPVAILALRIPIRALDEESSKANVLVEKNPGVEAKA
jgi:hypothetical protein